MTAEIGKAVGRRTAQLVASVSRFGLAGDTRAAAAILITC